VATTNEFCSYQHQAKFLIETGYSAKETKNISVDKRQNVPAAFQNDPVQIIIELSLELNSSVYVTFFLKAFNSLDRYFLKSNETL
jgi:hypothetical protein